ncbi:hypothetical protein SSX86_025643 [Deinandra increscens subsp. villosa]|uniref:C3H1-type domain-containing protein n=1 Tax=Deinandra increscens subsp. villosa TaxID=3103831 RepID=A0AAP0CJV9_9ASTR
MWFLQRLRCRGKMESFEAKSQLDNHQQLPDPPLPSDPSVLDDDKLVQLLAQDLENLVLSCNDEAPDRCIQRHSVAIDEENQVKQAIDEDPQHLVLKNSVIEAYQAESSSGSEDKNQRDVNKALEVNPEECRVSEERETGEICENLEREVDDGDDEKVYEHIDVDLKGKHEVEIEDGDVSSEIRDCENNNGGNDREDEQVEDLESESENVGGDGWLEGSVSAPDDGKSKAFHYPLRLDAEDCSYYIRTGVCKFGSNCKFNHPIRRKNQVFFQQLYHVSSCNIIGDLSPTREAKKQKEENLERHGPTECKFHTSFVGCKYGKACKFNHGRGKTVKTPVVEYNFVGLPIRPGEKECPYYMRNGSCKYGPSCRYNHPDPTVVGGSDAAPTTYGNDGPLPLQPTSQPNIPNMPSWSAPRTPDLSNAFVSMMYPPTQSMPPPNPDWNSYQAPAPVPGPVPSHVYPNSERGLPIPPAFFPNNQPSDTKMYTQHQQPMLVSEYPERPGQPDCGYFMKTGVCKYRASCKFNHPQSRNTRTSRDQNICTYFSRHGTCKYGQACKYDHPVNYNSNSIPAGEGYDGSNGPRHLIQQSL